VAEVNKDTQAQVPAFSLRQVQQIRGDVHILRDIDLDISAGEVVAVVGPSGAGKTSLIRLLNRLDDPTGGSVSYRGSRIESFLVRELRRRVAFVFQTPVMFTGTVADNLALARDLASNVTGTSSARAPEAHEVLRLAGVDPALASRDAQELSGGERQRVSIARALMTAPEVLLLDEPTSALDPDVADHIIATVRTLADTMHLTVVMVTHRLEEARAASTYTVFMESGRVIETGPTETMFTAPKEERTRHYLRRGR
ncbi:MAG: phosphate ABC transporter ATP-binding protein, partial [Gemmatimonadaceae bacterium]